MGRQQFDDLVSQMTYVRPNTNIDMLFNYVLEGFLVAAGFLAVVAFVITGVQYIAAGGDETKTAKAKKNLLWITGGIIAILLISAIGAILRTALTS